MKRNALCLLLAAWMILLPLTATAEIGEYAIAQVWQEPNRPAALHVRMESTDAAEGRSAGLTEDSFAEATIGTGNTPILGVRSVGDASYEGMCYVFVLDHAMGITADHAEKLRQGVNQWIDTMSDRDYAVVIIAEADDTRLVTPDFTSDKGFLKSAVSQYGGAVEFPAGNMIYTALHKAILTAAGRSDSLPRGCCIVACTNGADTYQTLVTGEQLATMLSENNLPLYVAGYADPSAKEALVGLINIARSSGGWSEDASPASNRLSLDEALARLHDRIRGGYDITLDCSEGFVFNGPTLLSLRMKASNQVIRRQASLYLLDHQQPLETASATEPPAEDAPAANGDASETTSSTENERDSSLPDILMGASAATLVMLLVFLGIGKRKKKQQTPAPVPVPVPNPPPMPKPELLQSEAKTQPVRSGNHFGDESVRVRHAEKPAENVQKGNFVYDEPLEKETQIERITFIYTIPQQSEQSKSFIWPESISIGRAENNMLCIPYQSVSANHALIECENGRVFITNNSEIRDGQQNPIYVDRRPVQQRTELTNGCHLNLGMVSFTVTWENAGEEIPLPVDASDHTVRRVVPTLLIQWSLRGRSGSRLVSLGSDVTIGRAPNDTVSIDDEAHRISNHHLRIQWQDNQIIIRNDSRIDSETGRNPFIYNGSMIVDAVPFENGMQIQLADALVTIWNGNETDRR